MTRGFKVFVKKWFIAVRPFSFPASVIPILFGTAIAGIKAGYNIDFINFFIALIAMIFILPLIYLMTTMIIIKK